MSNNGLEFDPGFAPYILAFRGSIEYFYFDISRFKNLSQKKMKFRQYYKKIFELFYNNLGFYIGCLMWAAYLRSQPEQEILNNGWYGVEYNEEENISDTNFMIKFLESLPKDVKYYLGEEYTVNKYDIKILELYRDFLILNRGFSMTKYNTDIMLPPGLIIDNVENYKEIIDNAIKEENLSKLADYKEKLCKID